VAGTAVVVYITLCGSSLIVELIGEDSSVELL
jgi:hypothetical protein